MNTFLKLWQIIAPKRILVLIRLLLEPKHYKVRRKSVLNYYKRKNLKNEPKEIQEGVRFLKWHKFTPLPFRWTLKYENLVPEVFMDNTHQRLYVIHQEKKLYYPRHFSKTQAIWATRSILKEQDPQSPHLYLTPNFQVEEGSIVVDAGVAEGNFALSVVEKAKKLYLIECDPEWIDTLKLTFAPWKEKVVFVDKFLAGSNSDSSITIDSLVPIADGEKYFIKMDIEGYEVEALSGARKLITSGNPVKMNVCTYHNPDDLTKIESILKEYGFTWQVSDGYILYFHEGEEPSFRRNLVRATKA